MLRKEIEYTIEEWSEYYGIEFTHKAGQDLANRLQKIFHPVYLVKEGPINDYEHKAGSIPFLAIHGAQTQVERPQGGMGELDLIPIVDSTGSRGSGIERCRSWGTRLVGYLRSLGRREFCDDDSMEREPFHDARGLFPKD